jgi:hypothetical protein
MVAGLEVTARCLVFICQGERGGAAGLLQVRASLGVPSWWCRRGKGGTSLEGRGRSGGARGFGGRAGGRGVAIWEADRRKKKGGRERKRRKKTRKEKKKRKKEKRKREEK